MSELSKLLSVRCAENYTLVSRKNISRPLAVRPLLEANVIFARLVTLRRLRLRGTVCLA